MDELNANPQGAESSNDPVSMFEQRLFKGMEEQPEAEPEEQRTVKEAAENSQAEEDDKQEAEEPKHKVKVNGQEIEVPLSELVAGYQRQADYTNKTKAVSEERRAVDYERQAVAQERNKTAYALQQAQVVLESRLNSQPDINELMQIDPMAAMQAMHQRQQDQEQLNQVRQQQAYLSQVEAQERATTMQQHLAQEHELLLTALPEWKDPDKARAEKTEIREWMMKNGYSDNDIDGIADHRHLLTLRRAMLYDQLISKSAAASKKVEKLPAKVERSGNGGVSPTDGRTRAMQALKQSGKTDAAAAIFEQML